MSGDSLITHIISCPCYKWKHRSDITGLVHDHTYSVSASVIYQESTVLIFVFVVCYNTILHVEYQQFVSYHHHNFEIFSIVCMFECIGLGLRLAVLRGTTQQVFLLTWTQKYSWFPICWQKPKRKLAVYRCVVTFVCDSTLAQLPSIPKNMNDRLSFCFVSTMLWLFITEN